MGFFAGKIYTQVIKLLTWWMALFYIWIQSDFLYHSTKMAWCYKKEQQQKNQNHNITPEKWEYIFLFISLKNKPR